MDKEQAVHKAQKLMAVALDGRGNGHEAERALAQAEALIRKFGLEQAEIASTVAQAISTGPMRSKPMVRRRIRRRVARNGFSSLAPGSRISPTR